jgi:hypothetical protein
MRTSFIAASALALVTSLATLSGCASAQAAEAGPSLAANGTTTTTSTEVAGSSKAKSGNKWEELHKSDSPDLKVHWPDGHVTVGLQKHIGDLDSMFAFAPDARIDGEPTKTVNGEWTTVVRVAAGTFTQPLSTPDGKTLAPTGKPFKIWIATITHADNGVVNEEYLFWNDKTLKTQIGI